MAVAVGAWLLLVWLVVHECERWVAPSRAWRPETRWGDVIVRHYRPIRDGIGGWAVYLNRNRIVYLSVEPYDDVMPVVPFLVTRWSFGIGILGRYFRIGNRYTKLHRYKSDGRSAWTLKLYVPRQERVA